MQKLTKYLVNHHISKSKIVSCPNGYTLATSVNNIKKDAYAKLYFDNVNVISIMKFSDDNFVKGYTETVVANTYWKVNMSSPTGDIKLLPMNKTDKIIFKNKTISVDDAKHDIEFLTDLTEDDINLINYVESHINELNTGEDIHI